MKKQLTLFEDITQPQEKWTESNVFCTNVYPSIDNMKFLMGGVVVLYGNSNITKPLLQAIAQTQNRLEKPPQLVDDEGFKECFTRWPAPAEGPGGHFILIKDNLTMHYGAYDEYDFRLADAFEKLCTYCWNSNTLMIIQWNKSSASPHAYFSKARIIDCTQKKATMGGGQITMSEKGIPTGSFTMPCLCEMCAIERNGKARIL